MLVGNVCYVSSSYNEDKFQLLLENQLSKRKGSALSPELIEQSIAAYLECKLLSSCSKSVLRMENLLSQLGLKYSDFRTYESNASTGQPEDAVRVFNQLANDFIVTQKKSTDNIIGTQENS